MNTVATFKMVVVGDGGVGKTSFVKRHLTGEFDQKYFPTGHYNITPLTFYTTHGPFRIQVFDTAGQQKLGGLRDAYYVGAHCAVIMFDVESRMTYKNVPMWYKDITRVCDLIPIVLLGNKVDKQGRKVKAKHITFHRKRRMQYFDVSAKSNYQIDLPFLWILQKLVGEQNLQFSMPVTLRPAEVELSPEQKLKLQSDLLKAREQPLPDFDEQDFI